MKIRLVLFAFLLATLLPTLTLSGQEVLGVPEQERELQNDELEIQRLNEDDPRRSQLLELRIQEQRIRDDLRNQAQAFAQERSESLPLDRRLDNFSPQRAPRPLSLEPNRNWQLVDGIPRFPSQRDAKLMKINNQFSRQIRDVVAQLKNAKDEEKKKEFKTQLGELLGKQYDAYLDHHEEPLKQLEARLEKLRADFEARKAAKTDLVQLRIDTIWYDAIGLGWPNSQKGNDQPDFGNVPYSPVAGPLQQRPKVGGTDLMEERANWIDDNKPARNMR